MKDADYIPYEELAGHLGVSKGDLLWLAADLTRLAFLVARKEGKFDTQAFIRSFQDQLTAAGTLVIPAFNFTLTDKTRFSRSNTLPITGALATEAMKMDGFIRTAHPLHSFLVWGREAEALAGLRNQSSFGKGSPFEFMHDYHGKMMIIGTSLTNAFTFVHYVEELQQVKYRKYKRVSIFVEEYGEWVEALLYAKRPGWTMDMSGLEKLLVNKKVAINKAINGIPVTAIDLDKSLPIIQGDIVSNNAGNISKFDTRLFLKDMLKPMLHAAGYRTRSDRISHDKDLR